MDPVLKGPTFRFKPGRVIELSHTSGRFGYLIAHFKVPRYGSFFTLITRPFEQQLSASELANRQGIPATTVWLNTYHLLATRGGTTFRHRCDLADYSAPKPAFWSGMVEYAVTIQHPNGSEETRRTNLSEREWEAQMEREGIIHKVLWLPKDIGAFLFDGVPLRWTTHKKY